MYNLLKKIDAYYSAHLLLILIALALFFIFFDVVIFKKRPQKYKWLYIFSNLIIVFSVTIILILKNSIDILDFNTKKLNKPKITTHNDNISKSSVDTQLSVIYAGTISAYILPQDHPSFLAQQHSTANVSQEIAKSFSKFLKTNSHFSNASIKVGNCVNYTDNLEIWSKKLSGKSIATLTPIEYILVKYFFKRNIHILFSMKSPYASNACVFIANKKSKIKTIYDIGSKDTVELVYDGSYSSRYAPLYKLYECGVIKYPNVKLLKSKGPYFESENSDYDIIKSVSESVNRIGCVASSTVVDSENIVKLLNYDYNTEKFLVISDDLFHNYYMDIKNVISQAYIEFCPIRLYDYSRDSILYENEIFEIMNKYLVVTTDPQDTNEIAKAKSILRNNYDEDQVKYGLFNHFVSTFKDKDAIVRDFRHEENIKKKIIINIFIGIISLLAIISFIIVPIFVKARKTRNKIFWLCISLSFVLLVEIIRTLVEISVNIDSGYEYIIVLFPIIVGIGLSYISDKNKPIIKILVDIVHKYIIKIRTIINSSTDILILEAKYGAQDKYKDVKYIVNDQINNGYFEIKVENDLFGDPLFGIKKELILKYLHNGEVIDVNIKEGDVHVFR